MRAILVCIILAIPILFAGCHECGGGEGGGSTASASAACFYPPPSAWEGAYTIGEQGCAAAPFNPSQTYCAADCAAAAAGREWSCTMSGEPLCCACLYLDAPDAGPEAGACATEGTAAALSPEDVATYCPAPYNAAGWVCTPEGDHCVVCDGCVPARGPQVDGHCVQIDPTCAPTEAAPCPCVPATVDNATAWCCPGLAPSIVPRPAPVFPRSSWTHRSR